jgi:hypothetical protein
LASVSLTDWLVLDLQPNGLEIKSALDPPEDVVGDIALVAQAHDGSGFGCIIKRSILRFCPSLTGGTST